MRRFLVAVALAALLNPVPASAQTPAQFDRLNTLTRYGMTVAWCQKLGMTLASDWEAQIEKRIAAEVASWGLAPDAAKQAIGEAMKRQGRIAEIDNDAFADANTKTEAGLRNVRSYFVKNGNVCLSAARDPFYAKILTVPANYDLQVAATEAADSLLKDGGLASWQTPAIQAAGDLMMAAGTCRRHIGAARSDKIFESYSHATDPRERAYYVKQFDDGLADPEFNFDATQCERLIARLQKKVAAKR